MVVRELAQVRPRDLASQVDVIVRDVGCSVAGTMLEFDFEAATKLRDIDAERPALDGCRVAYR